MKFRHTLIILLFLIPITALGALSVFDEDKTISESEKRTLKTMPDFTLSSFFSGEFPTKFEEYFSDTFPFRETLMTGNTELNRIYYFTPKSSDDNPVLIIPKEDDIGEGGETVPTPTPSATPTPASSPTPSTSPATDATPEPTPTPEPLPEIETPDKVDLSSGSILIVGDRGMEIVYANAPVITDYAGLVNRLQELLPDSRIISLISPTSGEFYSPVGYHTGQASQKKLIESAYSQLNDDVVKIDAYSELRKHTDEYIYFRTDHHWTQLGSYYAYVAFCKQLDITPLSLDEFEQGSIDGFVGSLFTFTSSYPQSIVLKDNPDTVHYYRPIRDFNTYIYTDGTMDVSTRYQGYVVSGKVTQANKYLAFSTGDTPLMHVKTDVDNNKKVLVIKESYGNAFVPYLVNHYEEVFAVDPRKYSGEDKPDLDVAAFIKEHNIDDVIVINYSLAVSSKGYVNTIRGIVK